ETDIKVKGMLAIFTYGFEIAEDNFKNAAVSLHTLSDYKNLLQLAEKSNYITASEADVLAAWRMNPDTWGQ
ncbi:MAG: orotate phosphoribosyltransferase, partial [Flavobacteriaceae bacterium]|nr:orotate phosphoribosyltransferase [Flavobacteriaceae bacterium]